MVTDTIDGVLIDSDEDGFYLILSGRRAEYRFNVQGVASELLGAAQREIGPWHAEGVQAAAEYVPWAEHPESVQHPKHPDHHDVMSGLTDGKDET